MNKPETSVKQPAKNSRGRNKTERRIAEDSDHSGSWKKKQIPVENPGQTE
jgi:hypothetical protein